MALKRPLTIILTALGIIVAGGLIFFFSSQQTDDFEIAPQEKAVAEYSGAGPTEVGTGWSVKENPEEAAAEAVAMALKGKKQAPPHFAVLFASSGSNLPAILTGVRKRLGERTKIYGGSSDSRAVMTNKKYVRVRQAAYTVEDQKEGVAIMTVTSQEIAFGVGSANLAAYPSAQEAAKDAVLKAMASAGKSPQDPPQAVLLTPTFGVEDQVLEGIAAVIGPGAILLGGTAGGPTFGVFGENGVYDQGLSLAVIYTTLPLAWVFEGGFDTVDTPTGTVTKVEGRAIMEIDRRPALEVYNEWLGGRLATLIKEGGDLGKIKDLLTLHPLFRKYSCPAGLEHFLFSHPYPTDRSLRDGSISTSTNIRPGDRVYLSHGTWEKLLNRIGKIPQAARLHSKLPPEKKAVFGLGHICAGVMGIIPETEREKMPFLINYTNNYAPFIANFTWGEQGLLPNIGFKHGNLLTSFLLIMER